MIWLRSHPLPGFEKFPFIALGCQGYQSYYTFFSLAHPIPIPCAISMYHRSFPVHPQTGGGHIVYCAITGYVPSNQIHWPSPAIILSTTHPASATRTQTMTGHSISFMAVWIVGAQGLVLAVQLLSININLTSDYTTLARISEFQITLIIHWRIWSGSTEVVVLFTVLILSLFFIKTPGLPQTFKNKIPCIFSCITKFNRTGCVRNRGQSEDRLS